MVGVDSTACRHCGATLSPDELKLAALDQELVEKAIHGAQNLKYVGWVTLGFTAFEIWLCLFAERIPLHGVLIQAVPAIGFFTALAWIKKYGALETDETDYPAAKAAVMRVMLAWGGVFLLQAPLLIVLALRIYSAGR